MSAKRPTMADVADAANQVLDLVSKLDRTSIDEQRPEYRARAFNARRVALITVRQELHEASIGRRSWPIASLETEAEVLRNLLGEAEE